VQQRDLALDRRQRRERGLPHVLLEIRQDLIADRTGAVFWAERLVPILRKALAQLESQVPARVP